MLSFDLPFIDCQPPYVPLSCWPLLAFQLGCLFPSLVHWLYNIVTFLWDFYLDSTPPFVHTYVHGHHMRAPMSIILYTKMQGPHKISDDFQDGRLAAMFDFNALRAIGYKKLYCSFKLCIVTAHSKYNLGVSVVFSQIQYSGMTTIIVLLKVHRQFPKLTSHISSMGFKFEGWMMTTNIKKM